MLYVINEVIKIIEAYKPLYYDVIFKAIFINKENEIILKNFLESYLKIKINNIRILNAELPLKKIKEQKKHMDVLIEIENKIINIELNAEKNKNIVKRNMAYLFSIYARSFHNNIKSKKETPKEYIQLNLNKFYFHKRRYKEIYHLRNEQGEILEKNIEIHEINIDYIHELWYSINKLQVILKKKNHSKPEIEEWIKIEKLRLKIRELNEEIKEEESMLWMGLIGSKSKEEFEYILKRKEMRKMAKEIKKAVNFVCDPTLVISEFDQADIDWYDRKSIKETGMEIGEKRGIKKGRKVGKIEGKIEALKEVAKNMLELNIDISTIMASTGLSKKQLENLK